MQNVQTSDQGMSWWTSLGQAESSTALALFRIAFGILVIGELLSQWCFQWFMTDFYFDTQFHFSYPGLGWLPHLHGLPMRVFVALLCCSFAMLALGWYYKVVKWTCFLGFAYLFFLERAAFLNHWYLLLLLSFFFLLIPAHQRLSLDVKRKNVTFRSSFPRWMRTILLLQVGLVYFFSGLAKLEPDWLSGTTMNLVRQSLLKTPMQAPSPQAIDLLMAWGTIALELAAFPLLVLRRTRKMMFIVLALFHLSNLCLFTIGTFPLVMIALNLLFLPEWPSFSKKNPSPLLEAPQMPGKVLQALLLVFFVVQISLPLRHHAYPGNTLWSEEGRLFSWDMFLAFKGGSTTFFTWDPTQDQAPTPLPMPDALTPGQWNKIFKSPDLILQFAHYIGDRFAKAGQPQVEVYATSNVTLNGRPPQKLHLSNVNLRAMNRQYLRPYWWVLPLDLAEQ